jgi:hypothetical protein
LWGLQVNARQMKVAKAAAAQALTWNEDDDSGVGGKAAGLKIVVLKHMFDPVGTSSEKSKTSQSKKINKCRR